MPHVSRITHMSAKAADKLATAMLDDLGPSEEFAPVVPNDATDIDPCRGLWVGIAGNVVVTSRRVGGATVTFADVQGYLPINPARVLTTTTADQIVALY